MLYPLSYGRIGTPLRCTSLRFAAAWGNAGAPIGWVLRCCVTMDGMHRSEQLPLLAQLAELVGKYSDELNAPIQQFDLGGKVFGSGRRPALMGVINLSRQSWYRESISVSTAAAIKRGRVLWAQGASVVDLGAESTQNYADDISPRQQVESLLPVIAALSAEVELAARHEAAVIMCFSQGENVRVSTVLSVGDDPIPMLIDHFEPRISRAVAAGVSRIFIDPGLGFHYENLTDGAERVRYQSQVCSVHFDSVLRGTGRHGSHRLTSHP
ncbi:MAG: dihydropteroate synthase [Actinobacteria bacterium]|nr:dihydropteroate synthase [Actinomycetota bacterium]